MAARLIIPLCTHTLSFTLISWLIGTRCFNTPASRHVVRPQNLGPESRKYRMLLQSFLLFIYLLLLLVVLPSFFCYCCCFCGPGLVPTLVDELESATRSDCSTIEDTGLSLLHTLPTTTSELPREEEKKKRRYELATSWRGSKIVCCWILNLSTYPSIFLHLRPLPRGEDTLYLRPALQRQTVWLICWLWPNCKCWLQEDRKY